MNSVHESPVAAASVTGELSLKDESFSKAASAVVGDTLTAILEDLRPKQPQPREEVRFWFTRTIFDQNAIDAWSQAEARWPCVQKLVALLRAAVAPEVTVSSDQAELLKAAILEHADRKAEGRVFYDDSVSEAAMRIATYLHCCPR